MSFSTLSDDGFEPFRVLQEKEATRGQWRSVLWPVVFAVLAWAAGGVGVLINQHRSTSSSQDLYLHLIISSLVWCNLTMYPASRGPATRPRVRTDGQQMEIVRSGSPVSGICRGMWALLGCGGLVWLIVSGRASSTGSIILSIVGALTLLALFLLLVFPEIGDTVIRLDDDTLTFRVGIAYRFMFSTASEVRANVQTIRHLAFLRISVDPPVPCLIRGRQTFRRTFTFSEFALTGIDLHDIAHLIRAQHRIRTSPDRTR